VCWAKRSFFDLKKFYFFNYRIVVQIICFKLLASEEEDLGLGLLWLLHLGTVLLVELNTAHWAAIVILEPVLDTGPVESMFAGQFAAKRTFLTGLEADVAI